MTTGRINQVARDEAATNDAAGAATNGSSHAPSPRPRPAFGTGPEPRAANQHRTRPGPSETRRRCAVTARVAPGDTRAGQTHQRDSTPPRERTTRRSPPTRDRARTPPQRRTPTERERRIERPLNERSPTLSRGSASLPETTANRRTRPHRIGATRRRGTHTLGRRRHRSTDRAADTHSTATSNGRTARVAPHVVRSTPRRIPTGKPSRPQADSRNMLDAARRPQHCTRAEHALAISGALKRPQPHEVAANRRWHRRHPPAAPALAALSEVGTLHAAPRCAGKAAFS